MNFYILTKELHEEVHTHSLVLGGGELNGDLLEILFRELHVLERRLQQCRFSNTRRSVAKQEWLIEMVPPVLRICTHWRAQAVVKRLLKKLGPGAAAQTFMIARDFKARAQSSFAFAFWSRNAAAAE